MNLQNTLELNDAALVALNNRDLLYEAQMLFRENVKKNICFITLHNMGVFYVIEGMVNPDGTERYANTVCHNLTKSHVKNV